MSDFQVRVVRIREIEAIPEAEKIEVAVVDGYRSVTQKGQFRPGDLAVYIPEAAILPGSLIESLGLTGRLAGADKNRVKAVKLRGVVSQGILMPLPEENISLGLVEVGCDLADFFRITKYEPRVPTSMQGEVCGMHGLTVPYDIENLKRYPDVLQDGEDVEFTEKLHGTFVGVTQAVHLNSPHLINCNTAVYSKGLGKQGLVFIDNETNANNLYLRTVKEMDIAGRIERAHLQHSQFTIFGEIFGPGVQDLQYGLKKATFAVFDIYLGKHDHGIFMGREYLDMACQRLGLPRVPILYRGPFSRSVMDDYTSGRTVMGDGAHVREGIVITPKTERHHAELGRVILKSVSPDYLFRKGNQTEYN